MSFTTLIDSATLAAHLDDPSFTIIDCRFKLDDASWGGREYGAGHLPGAVYAHLDRDLSGPKTGQTGRHPLPSPEAAAAAMGRLGIDATRQVIAYDQDTGMYAARLWWTLRWLGHDRVAVLDGGLGKWLREHRPSRDGVETAPARTFTPRVRPELLATLPDVLETAAGRRDWLLVDARVAERYRGETEPIDKVAGHIPGAVNYPLAQNLRPDGTYLPADELREKLAGLTGQASSDRLVHYCGSGVSACVNLLALEHAGLRGGRLYPGSWSEWSADPGRTVATGTEEK